MVAAAQADFGGLHILVNNAGISHRNQPLTEVSEEDFDRVYAINVKAIYLSTLAAVPPPEPFTGTLDVPLGARDGSESVFVADADGKAAFVHTFSPCLQMSDTWTTSLLAINYHSDGKTWGGHPGKFGYNAHIPLFVMLPTKEDVS